MNDRTITFTTDELYMIELALGFYKHSERNLPFSNTDELLLEIYLKIHRSDKEIQNKQQ
jgi:hypothetical protein